MDDDSPAGEARARIARGTMPHAMAKPQDNAQAVPVTSQVAQGSPGDEPARSIAEAVERLVAEAEAEDAVAEWSRGRA